MNEITFEENKRIQLEILIEVAKYCDDHHLKYFLTYGTLIGAVRHKGFIPWDDDIDIQMPRNDYNILISKFNQDMANSHFYLVVPGTELSRHSIVKIIDTRTVKIEPGIEYSNGYLGIDIDVFPIDGMPSDEKKYTRWRNQLCRVYRAFNATNYKLKGSFKHIGRLLLDNPLRLNKHYWLKKAQNLHAKYPYESCEYVGSMEMLWNGLGNRVKKECFESSIEVEFEGLRFRIPAGYDVLLRSLYGDYMKLPPEDQQITHHTNNVYWKD